MAHQPMNADKVGSDARGQSSWVDIGQGEEDETFALGAEAYVWCRPLALAAGTALVATGTDRPMANARSLFEAFARIARRITTADGASR